MIKPFKLDKIVDVPAKRYYSNKFEVSYVEDDYEECKDCISILDFAN